MNILDPAASTTDGIWVPRGPIPPKVRRFGRFPNVPDWCAGDLVLFRAKEPDLVQREIQRAQARSGYSADDAGWHHAAVYVGNGEGICEATRKGVQYRRIFDEVERRGLPDYEIRVRREPGCDRETGWKIAVNALTEIGKEYAKWRIARLYMDSFSGLWREKSPTSPVLVDSQRICSELYAIAYMKATGRVLANLAGNEITPAFLSQTESLKDIPLRWLQINRRSSGGAAS